MSERPWMPMYWGDYFGDTRHLVAAQHGAYLCLIGHYWTKGSLPDDDLQLAQIACMTPAEWRKSRAVIRAFFEDGWRHKRIDKEIVDAAQRKERRAVAGRNGGRRKASNARILLDDCYGSEPSNALATTTITTQSSLRCSEEESFQEVEVLEGVEHQGLKVISGGRHA